MIKKISHFLSRPEIFFFACLWLMVLLVLGTLAQRDVGLYQAQHQYFSCFISWIGWIPFPGGYTTLGIVFVGLLAKLLVKTPFKKGKLGILVIHLGALVLLLGGFLTGAFSKEGNMVIPEGATVGYVSDYHQNELVVIETTGPNSDQVTAFDEPWLKPGQILTHANFPFQIEIQNFFSNVAWQKRSAPLTSAHGFAQNFELQEQPPDKEEEKNVAGLTFALHGLSETQNGLYGIFSGMPVNQTLTVDQRQFILQIRRVQRHLPFQIQLIDFEKQMHPGTETPRSYRSVVNVVDDQLIQRQVIQMNEPLRYKGHTFYQASFIESGAQETTVLAVVDNVGAWFPYIASIILFMGLVLNMIMRLPELFRDHGKRQHHA